MSLYQKSNPNLPNYESQFSVRDIDRDVVTTMNQVDYYDYDITEKRLVSGPSDSGILAPVELDSGLPQRRTDTSNNPEDREIIGPDFILGGDNTSLTQRIDSVNNGRVGDIEVLDFNLPKEGDIVINKDNQDTSVKGIVEKTAVSDVFFSDMNIDVIHKSIRYGVNQRTGKVVARQADNTIYIVMRSILLQYANFRVGTADLAEEIRALNSRVIEYCADNISSNVQQYVGYIKDLEKLPVPMDRPVYHNKNNFTYDISNLL
jgi:hypothetical protein